MIKKFKNIKISNKCHQIKNRFLLYVFFTVHGPLLSALDLKPLLFINCGLLGSEKFFTIQTTLKYKPQEILFRVLFTKKEDRLFYSIFCCNFDGKKKRYEILTALHYKPLQYKPC